MRIHYVIFLLCLAGAAWGQATATPVSFNRTLSFAPVGVAASETIQVNLVNTAANGTSAQASCSGTISFSVPGAKTQPASVKFTVGSGQIFSTDLSWSALGSAIARPEVLASIQVTQTVATPCGISASLETFDTNSGVTHTYQTNPSSTGLALLPLAGN